MERIDRVSALRTDTSETSPLNRARMRSLTTP
jgi:hypothetical protein